MRCGIVSWVAGSDGGYQVITEVVWWIGIVHGDRCCGERTDGIRDEAAATSVRRLEWRLVAASTL